MWLNDVWNFVFSGTIEVLVKQGILVFVKIIWEWIKFIADPGHLVIVGVRILTAFLAWAESHVPSTLGAQIDTFKSFLQGAWFLKLTHVGLWFGDQLAYTPIVVLLFGSLFAFVMIVWTSRMVIWTFHQLWGSE